jgi:opacity protein-like surface antigen
MKRVLLIILGIAFAYGVNAQLRFGIKAGGTVSGLLMKKDGGTSDKSIINIGIEAGGLLEYSFSPSFAFQPELLYVKSGGKFDSEFYDDDRSFNLHQLQLPLNIKYQKGTKRRKFYVTAGPYFRYIFSAKETIGAVKNEKLETPLKRFDFGAGAGLGTEVSTKFFVEAGYKYGIANLTETKGETLKAGTFNLSFGYFF